MLVKKSVWERVFTVFNTLFMAALCFVTIYPLWHVAMSSFSDPQRIYTQRGMLFLPMTPINLRGYKLVLENPNVSTGFANTIFYVVVGTALSMFVTILGAYVTSRKGLYWNKIVLKLIVFTMYFQGGLIPFYMLVKDMGLVNTRWAIILPIMVNTWNFIMLRTSFLAVPESLLDSARIDGASEWTTVWRIVVPVAKATVAVILLFYAVRYWNEWFNPSIFLQDKAKFPIQLVLREILLKNDTTSMTQISVVGQTGTEMYRLLVKYCTIMVATIPILLVYPFVQKYFVAGVMIGSIKE